MSPSQQAQAQEQSPLLKHGDVSSRTYASSTYLDEETGMASSLSDFDGRSDSYSEASEDFYPSRQVAFDLGGGNEDESKDREKVHQSLWSRIDKSALQFAIRMSVLLSISALFVLIRTKKRSFPDGMWVLVSVLFVCWFPTLDAASVIEKIMQRLIGTFVGAVLGLSCGFASLYFFDTRNQQAVFLEICMLVFNFLIIFLAGQAKVGTQKVIRKFAYATILCVLTFCICMLPFALDEDPKWEKGVWRVINVIVGCFLGAIGSIVLCPRSTADVLHDKAARQVKMAGDAAEALLHTAADFFAGRIEVNRLADDILETPLDSTIEWRFLRSNSLRSNASEEEDTCRADIALKKYEEAIADWRLSKMLFPLAQYDPFHFATNKEESVVMQMEIARTLARALRIQTTIVVMDGMVRNDAEYGFVPSQLIAFAETGTLIKRMLTIPLHLDRSDDAARELFAKLEQTRKYIRVMSSKVSALDESWEATRGHGLEGFQKSLLEGPEDIFLSTRTMGDEHGRGIPKDVTGRNDNTLFFLQLVEHLVLRSLRLYQAWKHVEPNRKK